MSDELVPCPFCNSVRLSDECTGAAEISGHTYQTGWIECLDCGCNGPSVDLTDETPAQNDYQLVRDAWNEAGKHANELRLALYEADRLAGHDDAFTEWREKWAHLFSLPQREGPNRKVTGLPEASPG